MRRIVTKNGVSGLKKMDINYRKQIPFEWNHTQKNFINKTIHELFEIQGSQAPQRTR